MKILIGNILFAFVVLFNFVGTVRYVPPTYKIDPDPQPTYFEDIPEAQFHVEGITLYAGSGKKSGRTFNTNIIRTVPDTEYHKFFQFNILGTNLKFVFQRDEFGRILNVIKLDGNRRPQRGTDNLLTYVATIKGIQFLVHKNRRGRLLGASPPPHQAPEKFEEEDHTPRIEPEEPGPSHKRPRVVSTRTTDFQSGKVN